jgi:uncharacterized protein YggU (UPF0235/DUF167 family)
VSALAEALDLRRSDIEIVSGHTGRTKVVRVDPDVDERWATLLEAT